MSVWSYIFPVNELVQSVAQLIHARPKFQIVTQSPGAGGSASDFSKTLEAQLRAAETSARNLLARNDTNGDGKLDLSESRLDEGVFRRLDLNRDGFITETELTQGYMNQKAH